MAKTIRIRKRSAKRSPASKETSLDFEEAISDEIPEEECRVPQTIRVSTRDREAEDGSVTKGIRVSDTKKAKGPKPVYRDGIDADRRAITQEVIEAPNRTKKRGKKTAPQRRTLDNLYDAVFFTDEDGNILEANARATDKFGMSKTALTKISIIDLIAGADFELMKLIRESSVDGRFIRIEAICSAKGKRFDAEVVASRRIPNTELSRRASDGEDIFCFFIREIRRKEKPVEAELAHDTSEALDKMQKLIRQFNDPLQLLVCMAELEENEDYIKPLAQMQSVLKKLASFTFGKMPEKKTGQKPIGRKSSAPQKRNKKRVLIVNDNDLLRKMLEKTLSTNIADITIDSAANKAETIDLFVKHHHGLVVIDTLIPKLVEENAFQVLNEMCEGRNWESPAMVFCTNTSVGSHLQALLDKDKRHACLKKPFKPNIFVKAVRKGLSV